MRSSVDEPFSPTHVCFAAAVEELGPKGTTPGSASSKKAGQHLHKRAATDPVGEELDPSASTNASSPRHPKRKRALVNRSPTQQEPQHQQQQRRQNSSPSGSDQSSGSGSGPELQPASAHPQPSWRQQEQLEPEEEAPRASARPRSQSRPFSRSGSQTHTQAAERDPSARFRPHHHYPSRDSHEARQAAPSRGHSGERSPSRFGPGGFPSTADHRAPGAGPAAGRRGPDRADRHSPGPERAGRDRSAGAYSHYDGSQTHMGRQRPQHPQVRVLACDAPLLLEALASPCRF